MPNIKGHQVALPINLALLPPESFNLHSNDWKQWKYRLQRYRRGCGLDTSSQGKQIDVLICNRENERKKFFHHFRPLL